MEIVDGNLVITYTDGTTVDLGSITAGDTESENESNPYGIFNFEEDNGNIIVSIKEEYKNTVKTVTVPDTFEGKAVTTIDTDGFSSCVSLESIVLPDSISSIRSCAFRGCKSLTSITLPNNIITIKEKTFDRCTALTSITITENIVKIEEYAFNGCSNLSDVFFEHTSGWYCGERQISENKLKDPKTAANYLRLEYANCTWMRS